VIIIVKDIWRLINTSLARLTYHIDFSAIVLCNTCKRNKIDNVCATLPCGAFSLPLLPWEYLYFIVVVSDKAVDNIKVFSVAV